MNAVSRPSTSAPALLCLLAAGLAGVAAWYADLINVPVLAPCIDAVTSKVMTWIPILQAYPPSAWFITGGAEVGLVVLVAGLAVSGRWSGNGSAGRPMETRLRKRAQRLRQAHRAGFNS